MILKATFIVFKNKKISFLTILTWVLICFLFLSFSFIFFSRVKRYDWIYVGDTLNTLMGYSFYYSGIERGEYPIWNPLVRAGTNDIIYNILILANPILNLETLFFILLNNKDMIFSFSIFIYTMIIAYVIGIFLLVSSWTDNRYAGIFAAILAIGSSTVFFYTYHISFIQILYTIPWILYSLNMYLKNFHFKYLVLFLLSCCAFLYSYEFLMGLAYLIILLISYSLFCFKDLVGHFHRLKKIPVWHLLTFCCIFLFISLPIFLAFFQYKIDLLPISRINNINVSDKYTLLYKNEFQKFSIFLLFSKRIIINLFTTLFTGFMFSNFDELRQYIGPVAMLFSSVAIFSFRRTALCLALSLLLMFMLAGNLFPVNLLLILPVFDSIRNLHFFLQFFLMALIILAGFGFNFLTKDDFVFFKKIFNFFVVILLLVLLSLLIFIKHYVKYNVTVLLISFLVTLTFLYILNYSSTNNKKIGLILSTTTIFTVSVFFLISHLPILSGGLHNNKDLLRLRQRDDYSLKFLFERPDDIQLIDFSKYWERRDVDFGKDEYSSLLTLRDNSYKSFGRTVGFSSFPFLKNYYLFLSLPGHEIMMRNKFFLFKKFFISRQPQDMLAFKQYLNLFRDMLNKEVGIIDSVDQNNINMSLGLFNMLSLKGIPIEDKKDDFFVTLKEYKANSIRMTVATANPGLFTYTDLWDKGWHVKVDGKKAPLRKVFHTFKGIILPTGIHEIEFIYINSAYYPILFMNVIFIIMLGGLIIYLLKKEIIRFV